MYLITAPKILVLAPNCWETLTEFTRHKSRTWTQCGWFPQKIGSLSLGKSARIWYITDTLS